MKHAGDVVQRLALDNHLPCGVDDCNFRIRLRAKRSGIGIDVSAIDPSTVRRKGQVACSAAREQTFGFLPALEIDDGDVSAEAVGNIKCSTVAVQNNSARLRS